MLIDGGPCASQARARPAPLGRQWHVETSPLSGFAQGMSAVPSCQLLLGGSRLGKSVVVQLLPEDTGQDWYRLRFTPQLVLPICKIDV